jgi:hypothetical protein
MIAMYRALLVTSVLLLMASFVLPASHGIPLGKRLLDQPESWGFIFNTPDRRLMRATEEQTKQLLLSYLRDHHSRDGAPLSGLTVPALVAAIFSVVGWRRELDLRRRTNQMQ